MVALIKKGKPMFQELEYSSKTGRLAKNIKNTLVQTLINNYKIEDIKKAEKVANVILKAHGMAAANFDFVKNVEQSISAQFKQDTTAGEVDPNSNKGESSIKQILADAQGAFSKILGYDYLYRTMKEMYGKEEAKRLSGELYSFALALSDSTQILSPYCYAADFSKLVIEGRPWGNIHSAPAKRVDSYVQQVLETVHEMSNHLAGAIAISTFFFDIAHLIMYKDGVNTALKNVTLEDVKNDKIIRKSLENLFQTVIHSVNHTSRNGSESPFTNISIFDKTKIKSVKDTVPHLFMEPAGFDSEEEKEDYIVELIYELQNIYMGIFEKGDQLNDNRPVTFPVTTLNMSKDPKDDGTYEITDTEALKDFSNRQMYRYNINVSAGNRIAMCCFEGNENINVTKDGKQTEISIKDFVEQFDTDDHFTMRNTGYSITSLNPETLEEEESKIIGTLIKDNEYEELIDITIDGTIRSVTPDHLFLVKEIDSGEIKEIEARDLVKDFDRYLLPC
jgi:anaerobic ribonucleoside-triphosphate reductase